MLHRVSLLLSLVLAIGFAGPALAQEPELLKPYILASSEPGTIADRLETVKTSLTGQGFEIVGSYAPVKGSQVLIVTSVALKKNAAQSEFGAYGAIQRVSLTETPTGLQIAYTNPLYMAQVYRMKGGLAGTAKALEAALGKKEAFGSEKGLKVAKLRKYHYMMMMPYFDDAIVLAEYASQAEAIAAVEAGLTAGKGGTQKVCRVDVPGKEESVFCVALTKGEGADATIMPVVDKAELKHTAHLPYELVVSGGKVHMLHGKFRIAQSFPDLTMGTFMKISGAPSAIEESLETAVKAP